MCNKEEDPIFKKLLLGPDFASLFLTQRFETFQHVSSGSSPSKAGGNEHLLHKVSLKFVTLRVISTFATWLSFLIIPRKTFFKLTLAES